MATEEEIRTVKRQFSSRLLSLPGVSGVGIERDESGGYVLAIHLADPDARNHMPADLQQYPVKFIHSGPFRKLPGKRRI